jgi:hypothetical protein
VVIRAVPVPNPARGPWWILAVDLSAPADELDLRVYTVAENRAETVAATGGPWAAGWNRVSIPAPDVPAGLYYLKLKASQGGTAGWDSATVKLFYLP